MLKSDTNPSRRKRAGGPLCLVCGSVKEHLEFQLCDVCLKKDRNRKDAKRNKCKDQGGCCPKCGKPCLVGPPSKVGTEVRICLNKSCLKTMYRHRHLKDGVPVPSPEEAALKLLLIFFGRQMGSVLPPGYLTFDEEWLERRAVLVMKMTPGYYGS
jgi:hypothetical protein